MAEKPTIRTTRIKDYYTDKWNMTKSVMFTAIFSLAFVNLYRPFESARWVDVTEVGYFLYSCLFVFVGICVIALSRILMYIFVKRVSMSYLEYIIWLIMEVVILSGFYTLYVIWINPTLEFFKYDDLLTVFREVNINTFLVVFIPYLVSWLYINNISLRKRVSELESLGLSQVGVINFLDEKGENKLSLSSNSLIYIESADNYVEINYVSQNKINKFLLRNSMKRMEEILVGTNVCRCHRSFIVNMEHVTAMRRNGDELEMEFRIPEIKKIPISKTYAEKVSEMFMHLAPKISSENSSASN
jgi:hypothetical protein